ncbi:MAG: hypothetical protein U0414_15750 [Polyangiaceae bacterium]
MTRKFLSALFAVASITALTLAPASCQSGGIGDPCIPEDEYNPAFAGFKVTEDNIESRSFQCQSRICLVNHFQGRVTCPEGQGPPKACTTNADCTGMGANGKPEACVPAAVFAPPPDPGCPDGFSIQEKGNYCGCDKTADKCPKGFTCTDNPNGGLPQCTSFVCHAPDDCQVENVNEGAASDAGTAVNNKGKACCVPGTDTPVSSAVCGQCTKNGRNAQKAVYCSCRCLREGEEPDPNFNYCECPDGFDCTKIRDDLGIADHQLSGSYCVLAGTATTAGEAASKCGNVIGYAGDESFACDGIPSAP